MGEQKLGEAIDRGGGDEPAHFTKADVVAAVRKLWETCLATPPPKSSQDLWREHQELRQRIGEIHRMQLAAGGPQVELHPNKRSEEDIHGFLKWTEKVGIRFNGVTIAGGDAVEAEGFGLVSTRPLEPGEKVIVVPRKAMLSLDLAKKRVFQRDAITASMDNVGLALFVAIQRLQPDSSWTPYFKVLPGQFYTPLHYSKEELELLRGSPVFEEVLLMYRLAARMFAHFHLMIAKNDDYDAAKTGCPGDQPPLYGAPFTVLNFTFDLYRWAMTVVTTRINLIPSELETLDSGEPKQVRSFSSVFNLQITALIPGLDMANHAFLPDDPTGEASDTLMGVDESKEFAELLVTRRFDTEGEEIRSFYGKRTNSEFLMHNGFVPDGKNPWDRYRLKIGIPTSDKHVAARVAAADKLGFTDSGSRVYVFNIWRSAEFAEKKGAEADSLQGTAPFATALERFVRIFVADPPTQEVIDKVDTAKKAANWLKSRFELLLRPYQTLGEVDELAAPLTAVYANRLKTGEKEILQAALTFCQSWVRALEQST